MSPPESDLVSVRTVEGAGRGVVASRLIPGGTIVLKSKPPAAHVIFREYRKEICAQCFVYDRGRTLPVKHSSTGKVFCTSGCENEWLNEQGELGLTAWQSLHAFVQSKGKVVGNHNVLLLEDRPDEHTIESAWMKADKIKHQLQRETNVKPVNNSSAMRMVDPDILSYLVSGVLFFHKDRVDWRETILDLAMDQRPYRDSRDLEGHCSSFIQLSTFLPSELQSIFSTRLCQDLVSATSHNSFGIRSGSEDGEEYAGYALYPDASYFNHSCSPNIIKKRIGATWEFRAQRDLENGEECCITYLGGDEEELTVAARRARLRVHWGFECMCKRCLQENAHENT